MPPPTRETPGREPTPQPRSVLTGPPTSYAGRRADVRVQVEATPNSGNFVTPPDVVDWSIVTEGLNDNEHTATLTIAGLDANRLSRSNPSGNDLLGDQHFTHLMSMLSPNKRIRIGAGFTDSDPLILFQGWPLTRSVRWNEGTQAMTVTCISEGDEALATWPLSQILGQVRRGKPHLPWNPMEPQLHTVDASPAIFNPGGRPNRSPNPVKVSVEGHDHLVYLFCDTEAPQKESADTVDPPGFVGPPTPPGALVTKNPVHWTVVNALRYLCATNSNSIVSVSDFMQDTDALIDQAAQAVGEPFVTALTARLNDANCNAMSLREALLVVCQSVGLNFQTQIRRGKATTGTPIAGSSRFALRVFMALQDGQDEQATPGNRRMIMPKVRDLPRQAPFSDNTGMEAKDFAIANKAGFECDVTLDARAINRPTVVGGIRTYEVSLWLRPGWAILDQLDNLATGTSQADKNARKTAMQWWQGQLQTNEFDRGTTLPTSLLHGQFADHFANSDAARQWIFPDTMEYSEGFDREGWHLNLYQPFMPPTVPGEVSDGQSVYQHSILGGSILDASTWMPRRRPFRDTIGRHSKDGRRSPVVRICFDFAWVNPAMPELGATGTWRDFTGDVTIDTERAALRFNAANPWTDPTLRLFPDLELVDIDSSDPEAAGANINMIEAIIMGRFAVEVTCCIEGDSRITAIGFPGSGERARAAIVEAADRFQHLRRRGQNSLLNNQPTDELTFEDREDDLALADYAAKLRRRSGKETAAASVTVPWCDADGGWEVGDAITGCSGIDIPFSGYSEIVSKSYQNNGGSVQTTYNIGDLRHSPELA